MRSQDRPPAGGLRCGSYLWIPFQHIESNEIQPPTRLRDIMWATALVRTGPAFKAMELGVVLLPALCPFSFQHPDDNVRLGRATVWEESDGEVVPFGQKVFLADDEDIRCWKSGRSNSRNRSRPGRRRPRDPPNDMPLREDILNPISADNRVGSTSARTRSI